VRAPRGHTPIDREHLASMGVVAKARDRLGPPLAHAPERPAVLEQLARRGGPELRALRREKPPRDAVLHDLRAATDFGDKNGRAHGEALQHAVGERLVPGGQQRQIEHPENLRDVLAVAEEMHRVAGGQLIDEPMELTEVRTVVVPPPLPGEGDAAYQDEMGVEAAAAQVGDRSDGGVLGLPRGDLSDLAEKHGAVGEPELLAQTRRTDPRRIETGVVEAVVDTRRDRGWEAFVESPRGVVRDGDDRASRAGDERAHRAADRRQGDIVVRPDYDRGAPELPRDRGHDSNAHRVGVDHVRSEALARASQGNPREGELADADRSMHGM
jgi:hypothetical protein